MSFLLLISAAAALAKDAYIKRVEIGEVVAYGPQSKITHNFIAPEAALRRGTKIYLGDTLQTGKKPLEILLGLNTRLALAPHSLAQIASQKIHQKKDGDLLRQRRVFQLRLKQGQLRARLSRNTVTATELCFWQDSFRLMFFHGDVAVRAAGQAADLSFVLAKGKLTGLAQEREPYSNRVKEIIQHFNAPVRAQVRLVADEARFQVSEISAAQAQTAVEQIPLAAPAGTDEQYDEDSASEEMRGA